ncbi:LysM domain-containing protein [Geodermatophilus sp. DSM 44513]|uniref:LysM peptidoglycan-binding domain-containing protein n=1 Tax=Geodermatophilus sp. DSM 44513 TaxID=1528104 RepID=UPI0028F6EEBD|nr:LysM domain-containing protein [Geodermatophilus sp. DSM 44513]WNV74738.1 LysM domain-containing protein [Geodermatophilus sp. DSM 44513]
MSVRRLVGTAVAMAVAAVCLRAVTPDLSAVTGAGLDLQRAVDTTGADTVLLAAVAALAWVAWAWGALGLVLTALSALPGVAGTLARALTQCVLPAGARRATAVALGVGLVTGGPLLTGCTTPGPVTTTVVAASAHHPVADWPAPPSSTSSPAPAADRPPLPTGTGPVRDWPGPSDGDHVVLRGECLWDIAAADLARRTGGTPSDAQVATAVAAWWQANAAVIGPDPDLLLPGQVLRPPAS